MNDDIAGQTPEEDELLKAAEELGIDLSPKDGNLDGNGDDLGPTGAAGPAGSFGAPGPSGNIGAPGTPGPTGPTSAADNLGAHLLGRVPSTPDARDFKIEMLLSTDPADVILSKLLASKSVAQATKDWAAFWTPALKTIGGKPIPPPTPSGSKLWADAEVVLDQGQTPHCGGFGGCQFGNTDPVDDKYGNPDGEKLYYEAKVIDGEPNQENGTSVRSVVQALVNRGRVGTYAFSTNIETLKKFVLTNGPIMVGSDWLDGMFTPDANGYVVPTGNVAGGHFYLLRGFLPAIPSPQGVPFVVKEDTFAFLNSWGPNWAASGYFYMTVKDFASVFANGGEACAAVELP
jgi:hypothetical protein